MKKPQNGKEGRQQSKKRKNSGHAGANGGIPDFQR